MLLALSPSAAFGPAARLNVRSMRRSPRRSALRMDLYDDLGVTRSADAAEIKSAFRKKARKYHPDVNSAPDAQEKVRRRLPAPARRQRTAADPRRPPAPAAPPRRATPARPPRSSK